MSKRNCQDCRWDTDLRCNQGHFREWAGHWLSVENCHAWKGEEIIACKLINPQGQCLDWDLKVQKDWCKDCINHIIMPLSFLKEKCWCELKGEKRMQVQDYWIDQWKLGHYQMRAVDIANYCPYCGKRLEAT